MTLNLQERTMHRVAGISRVGRKSHGRWWMGTGSIWSHMPNWRFIIDVAQGQKEVSQCGRGRGRSLIRSRSSRNTWRPSLRRTGGDAAI